MKKEGCDKKSAASLKKGYRVLIQEGIEQDWMIISYLLIMYNMFGV